ncbi:MAG: hypothetical protein AB7O80_01560 [Acetobacteraceae bacterium]
MNVARIYLTFCMRRLRQVGLIRGTASLGCVPSARKGQTAPHHPDMAGISADISAGISNRTAADTPQTALWYLNTTHETP